MARDIQFGRYVEVELRDFNDNTKTTIGNDFEIEFDYFKTLDQTKDDDSGKIRIYGLTPETIKSLQFEGGEVILRCGYLKSSIDVLFIASIARLYYDKSGNTTVTTIECSANLMNHYFTGSGSNADDGQSSIASFFQSLARQLGFTGADIYLDNVPKSERPAVQEFLETFAIATYHVGSIADVLQYLANLFGFAINTDKSESGTMSLILQPVGVDRILAAINRGYVRLSVEKLSLNETANFLSTLEVSSDDKNLTILNSQTGLISSKTEYKIAYAYADQKLNSNEEETLDSVNRRNAAVKRNNESDAKYAERLAKAESEGKKLKPRKEKEKKRVSVQINRRYNRVKALLNPLVKPQSMVAVLSNDDKPKDDLLTNPVVESGVETSAEIDGEYTAYRVRNATYKGNNKQGDWIMDLYCEDTTFNEVSNEEVQKFLSSVSPEDIEHEEVQEDISQYDGE